MAHRLGDLVGDRHGRRRLGGLTGRVQNHLPALAAEQRHDDRHSFAHVVLERRQRFVVQLHHRRVQGKDRVLRDLARVGGWPRVEDWAHEIR
jgi:hypothetical protein